MERRSINVILIRHAESEDNVKVQHLNEGIQRVKQLRLPSLRQIVQAARLLEFDTDGPLSSLGKRQIAEMAMTLKEVSFWDNLEFDICAYSPLKRVKETYHGLVPPTLKSKCVELDCLREVEPYEHIIPYKLKSRLKQLEDWLIQSNKSTVVLVGHSRYFCKLMNAKSLMWNCDVWQASFRYDQNNSTDREWRDATLLFRSPLAVSHPVDSLFSWSSSSASTTEERGSRSQHGGNNRNNSSANGNEVVDDFNEVEENTCRICQAKQSESPNMKLIRPCKCSGSQAHVHTECLNQWRATSEAAFKTCSVCRYEYRTRHSRFAALLMTPALQLFIAIFTVLFAALLSGYATKLFLDSRLQSYIDAVTVTDLLGIPLALSQKTCRKFRPTYRLANARRIEDYMKVLYVNVACSSMLSSVSISLLLGLAVVGIFCHINHYYQLFARRHQEGHWPGMMFISFWICNDLQYSLRLFIVLGFFMGVRCLYMYLASNIRQYGHQLLGNSVLEVDEDVQQETTSSVGQGQG